MSLAARRGAMKPSGGIQPLRLRVASELLAAPEPQPRFTYHVLWSDTYNTLLLSEGDDVTDVQELYFRARRSGRVIVCARGGGAKTVILHRLAKLAFAEGDLPVLIDLKKWTEPAYKRWKELREDGLERAAFLLDALSVPSTSLSELESLPADVGRVILVDGLNEVPLSTGNSVLETLDTFVRRSINTFTVVTDRLVRREPPNMDRWKLATIQPLPESEIRRHVKATLRSTAVLDAADPQTRALLSTPYFLNVLLEEGEVAPSSSRTFRRYFTQHVSLTPSELSAAGAAAYCAYSDDQSRVFKISAFVKRASQAVWDKLCQSGAVLTLDGDAYFAHHLQHDYLSSTYIAADHQRWTRDAFNVVSLRASSFDAIALVLEQLPTTDEADLLVRKVYDWNPYAAAYATAEGLSRLSVQVSEQMQIVLLAMLGERRWDLIEPTAQRAVDAISVFPGNHARRILNAASLTDIFQLLNDFPNEPQWFREWRDLFTRPIGSQAEDADLTLLLDDDSIVGWTSANVLKRLALSDEQLHFLRAQFSDASVTTRWRIAHVLGAFPTAENAEILHTAMQGDKDEWVRYGAIRSLVELAARTTSHRWRNTIFDRIADSAFSLLGDRRRLEEFEKAIFIRPDRAPADWVLSAGKAIEALYELTVDSERRERWIRLAHSFKSKYTINT